MVLRVIEMIGRFAKLAASFSLMLCVSVSAPAFSSSKHHDKANCPYAKARLEQAKRSTAATPTGGLMIVDKRKRDVQILSFGP